MQRSIRKTLGTGLALVALLGTTLPGPAAAQAVGAHEDFTSETLGAFPTSFSTPVGFWSIATNGVDNKPLLFEDGTQWAGSQAGTNFANQAQAVYGARWNEFIDDLPGTAYFPIAIFNAVPNFTVGTITTRLATVGGNLDQDAGIMFNYQPNGDMMALRMDALENNIKLYQWTNGQPVVLKLATNVPTAMARWHDLSVVVSNGGYRVSGVMDGLKFLETDLETPVSGQVGAWAKADTVVLYDFFTVDPNAQ
jgi:pyruvate, water dikinase